MDSVHKWFGWFINRRAWLIAKEILPYVNDGDKVLDFGCGDMIVSKLIAEKKKIEAVGIDTVAINHTDFKVIKYEGGRLPFEDNEFDVVISSFVLHHTDNPEFYLEELKRVSRRKIVLMEDVYNNKVEEKITKAMDLFLNRALSKEIKVPYNFRSVSQWKENFEKMGLKLDNIKRFYPYPIPLFATNNVVMVLRKSLAGCIFK